MEPCVKERDGEDLGALPLGVAVDPGSNPAAPDVLVAHSSNAENGAGLPSADLCRGSD